MALNGFAASAYSATQTVLSGPKPTALSGAAASGLNFGSLVTDALNSVSQSGKAAEAQAVSAATGKADLIDVVTAVSESETALQTLVSVRDRMISAYEEIMRMQI